MKLKRAVLRAGVLAAVLAAPAGVNSCGPFLPEAIFALRWNPDGPLRAYDAGRLGVLRPAFYRRHLIVAWRVLHGMPLNARESEATDPTPRPDPSQPWRGISDRKWEEVRARIPGAARQQMIGTAKAVMRQGLYVGYVNCLDDAFLTAAATLNQRAASWGAEDSRLREWLAGQDAVFANCSGPRTMPANLPPGADRLLAQDRAYQTAAATFYAGEHAKAAELFAQIAADQSSPWRQTAKLLVARALIREESLDGVAGKMTAAAAQLWAVLNDVEADEVHASARRLLDFVETTLHPQTRLVELGRALNARRTDPDLRSQMQDYTLLFDRLVAGRAGDPKELVRQSELADWLLTFQRPSSRTHAIDRWTATRNPAWLIAALASAPKDEPRVGELLAAAEQVPAAASAWASVAWYAVRVLEQRGEQDAARRWADRALAATLPPSSRNLFLGERLALSHSWGEFLRYAPREPAAISTVGEDYERFPEAPRPGAAFDTDAVRAFNEVAPLTRWMDAATSGALPRKLEIEVAAAGWVRAMVLDRGDAARKFAVRLVDLKAPQAAAVQPFLAAADDAGARDAAALALLNLPGLAPFLRPGLGRLPRFNRMDVFRDNWWPSRWEPSVQPPQPPPYAAFLMDSERAEGRREFQQLQSNAPAGAPWLGTIALAWVRNHATDPHAPEVLALILRAGHYDSSEEGSPVFRQAFVLLKTRYAATPWARETKYWFR